MSFLCNNDSVSHRNDAILPISMSFRVTSPFTVFNCRQRPERLECVYYLTSIESTVCFVESNNSQIRNQ